MRLQEKYNYGGWPNCLYLSNDEIELIATTDVGPRIIRFGFIGKHNLFKEIKDDLGKTGGNSYRLYGGARIWHAPEEIPRCCYPDNLPVNYKWNGETLVLLQNTEIATGLQKEINVTLSPSKNIAKVVYRIYNNNAWDLEYSPWALSLMETGGKVIIPQEPFQPWGKMLTPVRPIVLWPYTDMSDARLLWGKKYIQIKQNPKIKNPLKIGALNTLGWEAYYLNGYVFIKRHPYNKDANYPDFQSNVEVFVNSSFLELESLGPLEVIKHGGYSQHTEYWYLFKNKLDENSLEKNILTLVKETETLK